MWIGVQSRYDHFESRLSSLTLPLSLQPSLPCNHRPREILDLSQKFSTLGQKEHEKKCENTLQFGKLAKNVQFLFVRLMQKTKQEYQQKAENPSLAKLYIISIWYYVTTGYDNLKAPRNARTIAWQGTPKNK